MFSFAVARGLDVVRDPAFGLFADSELPEELLKGIRAVVTTASGPAQQLRVQLTPLDAIASSVLVSCARA